MFIHVQLALQPRKHEVLRLETLRLLRLSHVLVVLVSLTLLMTSDMCIHLSIDC